MKARRTTTSRIPVEKIVPFFANPPNRTDQEAKHFRSLVSHIEDGGSVENISVTRDEVNDKFLLDSGHRRTEAFKVLGREFIPATITYPNVGETPKQVQTALFKEHNKNKPIVGKDYVYIALFTQGEVVIGSAAKKVWGLTQAHFPNRDDHDFLLKHATGDLFGIALSLVNLANNTDTNKGKPMTKSDYSLFFRQSVRWLVEQEKQFKIRTYIKGKSEMPKTLRTAIINRKPFEF